MNHPLGWLANTPHRQPAGLLSLTPGPVKRCIRMTGAPISAATTGDRPPAVIKAQSHRALAGSRRAARSPLFNHRTDQWDDSITARCRIVMEIIAAVRVAVGSTFPIGVCLATREEGV